MSNKLKLVATELDGLYLIERTLHGDIRGGFERLYCGNELTNLGCPFTVAQINRSFNRKRGTLRGMHFQNHPYAEHKLITCLKGRVCDVAIDLRRESKTFKHWFATELSEKGQKSILIPPGFAHGFQTLTDDVELLYMHDQFYTPECEGAVNALDPSIGVQWPLEITNMSDRDKNLPYIEDKFSGI